MRATHAWNPFVPLRAISKPLAGFDAEPRYSGAESELHFRRSAITNVVERALHDHRPVRESLDRIELSSPRWWPPAWELPTRRRVAPCPCNEDKGNSGPCHRWHRDRENRARDQTETRPDEACGRTLEVCRSRPRDRQVRPVRSLSVIPSRIGPPARVLSSSTRVPERNDAGNTLVANVLTAVRADRMCEHAREGCSDLAHVRIKHTFCRVCPSVSIPRAYVPKVNG